LVFGSKRSVIETSDHKNNETLVNDYGEPVCGGQVLMANHKKTNNYNCMKILIFLIALLFMFSGFASDFYSEEQLERVVKIALKQNDISLVGTIALVDGTLRAEPTILCEFSRPVGDNFYVVLTQAKGRYDYFDYLMEVNNRFEIEKIRILKYRSEHGGEIKSKKWLAQFENYSTGELRYKKEISALSGATLSATGLVADVPKVLELLKNSVVK
jgi:hypothetical protein